MAVRPVRLITPFGALLCGLLLIAGGVAYHATYPLLSQEETAWAAAEKSGTIEQYQHYLKVHPDGIRATKAREALAAIEAKRATEETAWAEVEQSRTLEGLQRYIARYPDGKNATRAREVLAAIEAKRAAEAKAAAEDLRKVAEAKPGEEARKVAEEVARKAALEAQERAQREAAEQRQREAAEQRRKQEVEGARRWMQEEAQREATRKSSVADRRFTAEEQQIHDRLSQTMQSAHYAFNHPSVLYLSRRAQITFTLAAKEQEALDALGRQFEQAIEGTAKSGTTVYTPVMSATLRGKAFKIEPSGEQPKMVLLGSRGPVEWTWFVEPLELGKGKLLFLELSASVEQTKERSAPLRLKTFEARIDVDVQIWDRVLIEARRMTPIAQAMTGVGGVIAFLGFIGAAVRWLRRGRKRAAPTVA